MIQSNEKKLLYFQSTIYMAMFTEFLPGAKVLGKVTVCAYKSVIYFNNSVIQSFTSVFNYSSFTSAFQYFSFYFSISVFQYSLQYFSISVFTSVFQYFSLYFNISVFQFLLQYFSISVFHFSISVFYFSIRTDLLPVIQYCQPSE